MLLVHNGLQLPFKTEEEKKYVWWRNVILITNEILTKLCNKLFYCIWELDSWNDKEHSLYKREAVESWGKIVQFFRLVAFFGVCAHLQH